jgi:perosamine synthetase
MPRDIKSKHVLISPEAKRLVGRVLDGGKLHGRSEVIQEYEAELAQRFSCTGAVAVNSGTTAIELALLACGVKPGGRVLVPACAPVMTGLGVLRTRGVPIFYDSTTNALQPSLDDIDALLAQGAEALVTVSMWGYPTAVEALAPILQKNRIPWIEDGSQAHGSSIRGTPLGPQADATCFSTHERKLITTGEGGFLNEVRSLAHYGGVSDPSIAGGFRFGVHSGGNLKISALQAALGLSQISLLGEKVIARRQNSRDILTQASPLLALQPQHIPDGHEPNAYSLLLISPEGHERHFAASILAAHGIENDVRDYDYQPLYEYPLFARFARHCTNTASLCRRIVVVPTHEGLSQDDVEFIAAVLRSIDTKLIEARPR